MPHITFIHGIANKPPKERLLSNWEGYLAEAGLDLASVGVTTSMVYWADVMYKEPEDWSIKLESVDDGLGTSESDEDLAWISDLPDQEKAFVEAFSNRLGFEKSSPEDDNYTPPEIETSDEPAGELTFEAIPLPWFIKRRVMKSLLRDVHHYLFNAKHSPRPGESYRVQDHIRRLFVEQLKQDVADNEGPHLVIGHSMGTVISYDCLKNVADCPSVDAYMTVGCPLGVSEVYDNFKPEYDKHDAFPSEKVAGDWVNVFDRFDPVAFDAHLANDYRKQGNKVVIDQKVKNSGLWRHSSYLYFHQQPLIIHLERLLQL